MNDPRFTNFSKFSKPLNWLSNIVYALVVTWLLATIWMPLGVNKSNLNNFFFVVIIAGSLIGFFYVVIYFYENILRFLLRFKVLFLLVVGLIIYQGIVVFQNIGEEFMPSLDEGSFLLMPTSMPHAGMQENIKNLRLLDMAVTAIPEVETVVGKLGRVESALDPAPISMFENIINYKNEYITDEDGNRLRFKTDDEGRFLIHSDDSETEIAVANEERFSIDETKLIQDENGQIVKTHSVSAGLDYPGVGPEHAWLKDIGRAEYAAVTDDEALEAFHALCRYEGIMPALESSHALAYAAKYAPTLSKDKLLLVNLSGRGDKDMATVAQMSGLTL